MLSPSDADDLGRPVTAYFNFRWFSIRLKLYPDETVSGCRFLYYNKIRNHRKYSDKLLTNAKNQQPTENQKNTEYRNIR